jgi:hypothetical protein
MYQTDYIITYHKPEVFLETDQITDAEKDFIRNCIYRQDLLNLFDLEDFDEKEIDKNITEIYEKVKLQEDFLYALEKLRTTLSISKETAFTLLFSFDFLYATHLCLCDFFETGQITQEHKVELITLIHNFCTKE